MQKLSKIFFGLLFFALFLNESSKAAIFFQVIDTMHVKKDSSVKSAKPTIKNEDTVSQHGLIIHPIIRVGTGMLSYIGNVRASANASRIQNPSNGRVGFDVGVTQKLSPVTEFSLDFLYGKVAEAQLIPGAYWNFQSSLEGGGFNFLFKMFPKNEVTPYGIIGVESYEFFSTADIYDQYGDKYYDWTDGTLRSLPQNSPNAASAKILSLSYDYSTDIRSLDLDGSGKYTQQTFAIPLGLGFMFRVGTRANFMIGSTLHYMFTDHIDGLTPQVQGPLKGSMSHDKFLFSYVSLRFNLTRDHPRVVQTYDTTGLSMIMNDTVTPYQPGEFDTSAAVLQKQYEMYMDSTGKFGQLQVDSFSWKSTNNITPTNTDLKDIVIYKIQLFTTRVQLAEGITFAGINDRASVTEENGMYIYTTRDFTTLDDAKKYLEKLKLIGYTDAFIRAIKDGKDVPVQ